MNLRRNLLGPVRQCRGYPPFVLSEEVDNTGVRVSKSDKAKKVGYLWEGSSEGEGNFKRLEFALHQFCYQCAQMIEENAFSGESTYKSVCK
jgi:hypothetical protein